MLKLGLFFFVVALVAGLFGFAGIAGAFMFVAQVIFFIALVLLLLVVVAVLGFFS